MDIKLLIIAALKCLKCSFFVPWVSGDSQQSWVTSHILVWAVITPSCLFHFLLLLHFRLCVQSFLWNPLPRIAEQHLRLCPTPEGSESESPSVCRPLTLQLWRSEGMTEIWPEFMTWILQLSLPSASAFSPDASTTWFWAAMCVTVVVDDRCAARWLCYSSSGPFRWSGGAAGMTEFTAEPSGGVVGKTQWNICEGRRRQWWHTRLHTPYTTTTTTRLHPSNILQQHGPV